MPTPTVTRDEQGDYNVATERRDPVIATHCIFPPIPDRRFDWCAYYDGHEEAGPYGYGATEAAAIADLIDNYDSPGGQTR